MRKTSLLLAAVFMMCIFTAAWGQTSRVEVRLDNDATELNEDSSRPGGETVVVERLETRFNVDDALINSLRSRNLGYGEINIVLAMAERLPGGITTANINEIMLMRQGPHVQGWGVIAKKLGLKLGPVVSSVEKNVKSSRSDIERLEREKGTSEKTERPERMERPERPERMERMERMERPERMEKPDMPMRK